MREIDRVLSVGHKPPKSAVVQVLSYLFGIRKAGFSETRGFLGVCFDRVQDIAVQSVLQARVRPGAREKIKKS